MANRIGRFSLFLWILFLPLANPASAAERFVDPTSSYGIVPPQGWQVITITPDTVEFRAKEHVGGYHAVIRVMRNPGEIEKGQFDLGNTVRMEVPIGKARFQLLSEEKLAVKQLEAFLVVYEHSLRGFDMKTAETHLVHKGERYVLIFNTVKTAFDRYYPFYRETLKTFSPEKIQRSSPWEKFISVDGTIQAEICKGWKAHKDDSEMLVIGLSDGRSYPGISVEKNIDSSAKSKGIAQYGLELRTKYERAGGKFLSIESVTIDNNPVFSHLVEIPGLESKPTSILTIESWRGGVEFTIRCIALSEEFSVYKPVFEHFIQSFHIEPSEKPTKDSSPEWLTFTSTDRTIQGEIPGNWKIISDTMTQLEIRRSRGSAYPSILIEKFLLPSPRRLTNADLKKAEKVLRERYEKEGWRVLSAETITLGGALALRLTTEFENENEDPVKGVLVKGTGGNYEFSITCTSRSVDFDSYRPLFDRFVQSLRFKEIFGFIQMEHADGTTSPIQGIIKSSDSGKKIFVPTDKTFEISFPESWAVDDKMDLVIFYPAPQDKRLSFSVVKRHKLSPSDLKEWEAETKGVFVTESEKLGYRFEEFKETSVDGRPGLRAVFQREKDGVAEKGVVIRIFTPAMDFELNYTAPPNKFEEFLPIFEQFVQSFRVTEK